jgi:siroheme synthase-like protein
MAQAPPYPLFVDLEQKPVLIVGGGAVALRKARGLCESGAAVTVVSPRFCEAFEELPAAERMVARYQHAQLLAKKWRLVFAATDLPAVNAQVYQDAQAAGILCCRCDEGEESDFSNGATHRLGMARAEAVTIAVSTGGASPVLAARICRQAATAIDPVLPALAALLGEWRASAKAQIPDAALRTPFLRLLAGESMERALRDQGEAAARTLHRQWLAAVLAGGLAALPPGATPTPPQADPAEPSNLRTVDHAQ